jgi:GDP-mannose 4,6-dehydratase
MFKKALITGITGFVGSHLAEFILKNHKNIKVYGLLRWRSPKNNILKIQDKINFCYGDLEDYSSLEKIISTVRPDVIFHLAAQSYVDFSFISPISTLKANVVGTGNLLEVIKTLKLKDGYDPTIHICSSSEVYGQVKKEEVPITEENPFRPASPYAVSKVGEDMLALQYFLSWKIKTIRTRMFTHEGPRRGEVFAPSNFAKQVAAIEKGKQNATVMVGNLKSVRTFMDVRDAVKAYWMLVNKCIPGEVYNIGGVETMTVGDMLERLISFSKKKNIKIKVDPKRLRPSDVTLQIPSVEKFIQQTGWKPEIKFDTTLKDMLEYWREYYEKNL